MGNDAEADREKLAAILRETDWLDASKREFRISPEKLRELEALVVGGPPPRLLDPPTAEELAELADAPLSPERLRRLRPLVVNSKDETGPE